MLVQSLFISEKKIVIMTSAKSCSAIIEIAGNLGVRFSLASRFFHLHNPEGHGWVFPRMTTLNVKVLSNQSAITSDDRKHTNSKPWPKR